MASNIIDQRVNFASVKNPMPYPDFLEVQLRSFKDFLQLDTPPEQRKNDGLYKVFSENFPIADTRNNFVLEFLDLKDYPALHESDIEQALIDHLQQFLLELGRGFCFVGRQRRMRYDDEDFYVDLVFYHSILKCHVLIDLKLGKLTHEDVGQMDSYIRMWDALYKNEDDNPTLGIILCSQKSEAIVKYSVLSEGKQLFASRYKLYLPTEEEFKRMLESIE